MRRNTAITLALVGIGVAIYALVGAIAATAWSGPVPVDRYGTWGEWSGLVGGAAAVFVALVAIDSDRQRHDTQMTAERERHREAIDEERRHHHELLSAERQRWEDERSERAMAGAIDRVMGQILPARASFLTTYHELRLDPEVLAALHDINATRHDPDADDLKTAGHRFVLATRRFRSDGRLLVGHVEAAAAVVEDLPDHTAVALAQYADFLSWSKLTSEFKTGPGAPLDDEEEAWRRLIEGLRSAAAKNSVQS